MKVSWKSNFWECELISICFSLKRLLPLRTVYTSLFSTGLHLQNSLLKVTFKKKSFYCVLYQVPSQWTWIDPYEIITLRDPLFRCATWKVSLTAWRKGEGRVTAWVQSCLMKNRFHWGYSKSLVVQKNFHSQDYAGSWFWKFSGIEHCRFYRMRLQLLDWLQNFKEIQTELNSCLTCLEVLIHCKLLVGTKKFMLADKLSEIQSIQL